MLAIVWLASLVGGCFSNPTPHPEQHDAHRYTPDALTASPTDKDEDKGNGGDDPSETPTGNYDGADVIAEDVDPCAALDDDVDDGVEGDACGDACGDATGWNGGGASNDQDYDGAWDDAGPTEANGDFSSSVGGPLNHDR